MTYQFYVSDGSGASVRDQKRRRFEDYLPREGFAEIELSLQDFRMILTDAVPDGEWADDVIDAALDEVREHFARAVGEFGWFQFNAKRRDLEKRLALLRENLETAVHILASAGHLREKIDIDLLGFIANVAVEVEPSLTSSEMKQKCASVYDQIRDILKNVKAAENTIKQCSTDGPARASYYDRIVEGTCSGAQILAIPLTTGGDRSRDSHDTPFVRFVKRLESFLPSQMQSNSLAACAKRIERSPAWRSSR
jgi:hypothetical protein